VSELVAHVTPWGVHCGVAKHFSYWLGALPAARRSVILAEDPPDGYGEPESWGDWPVRRCWQRYKPEAMDQICAAIEETGARLVHWQWLPDLFVYKALLGYEEFARYRGIRTVATVHTLLTDPESPFLWQDKWIGRVADVLCAGTPGLCAAVEQFDIQHQQFLRRPPVRYVPLAAPICRATNHRPRTGGRPRILTWGFFGARKRCEIIIEAVARLRSQGFPHAEYWIMGQVLTGEQRQSFEALQALAEQHPGLVHIREGFRTDDEIYEMCADADVIALNHEWPYESSSGTVALSVASRTPVVVSDSAMFAGYVEPGAVLVAGDTPETWARVLAIAVRNPLATAPGRRIMRRRTSPANVAARYESIYQELESEDNGEAT